MKAVKLLSKSLTALVVAAAALLWSGELPTSERGSFVATAEAWVGYPATPRSYAGVARRTTRRAVAVGAATGAVAVGTAVVATGAAVAARNCVRIIDAYGRTAVVCR